jgi:uncharacterized Tic20 family protein
MSGSMKTPAPTLAPDYVPSAEEKQWGVLAHLAGLIASLLGGLSFLGPLVVWLIKKDQSPFVGDQAKEALNFQISVTIAMMVAMAIAAATCIAIVLVPIVWVGALVYAIVAAMEVNKGVAYRYPYTIRLIQ